MESRPVDHVNPYTNQIFQEAIIRNDYAVVKLLLKYGIYPSRNERNRQGLTALQQSVLDGHGKMAIVLLESNADIEAKTSNGWTCLHIASALGDLDILTTLINHCADLIALTKNEELPIDLAATREIKIKLAKEMSRVGYSELAQWYMRKLAAREGVFYVLSTDTLLDLACDDHYDKSYSTAYPYYVRHYNEKNDAFIHSPAGQNTTSWSKQESETMQKKGDNLWLEVSEQNNATYLTYSSGYISETVFNSNSEEYSRIRNSSSVSSTGSPQRKQNALTPDDVSTSRSLMTFVETSTDLDGQMRFGTLKKNKRNSQNMQRKPSTIELHIDYTNSTEDDADDDEQDEEDYKDDTCSSIKIVPRLIHPESSIETQRLSKTADVNTKNDRMNSIVSEQQYSSTKLANNEIVTQYISPLKQKSAEQQQDGVDYKELKNVRFKNLETSNEFCNCPNCKKMGYAFSPDIRSSSRKVIHLGQPIIFSPEKPFQYGMMPASNFSHPHYYPTTTVEKHDLCYDPDRAYKPRKRKKKLFSGIKSMFKDSIRVHRANPGHAPVMDDAGILFSVSIRDRDKAKTIQQRHVVRKSNSFSGSRRGYDPREVNIYPHSQVIPPPTHFSDSYDFHDEYPPVNDPRDFLKDSVFEKPYWLDYQDDVQNTHSEVYHHGGISNDALNMSDTTSLEFSDPVYEKRFKSKHLGENDSRAVFSNSKIEGVVSEKSPRYMDSNKSDCCSHCISPSTLECP